MGANSNFLFSFPYFGFAIRLLCQLFQFSNMNLSLQTQNQLYFYYLKCRGSVTPIIVCK